MRTYVCTYIYTWRLGSPKSRYKSMWRRTSHWTLFQLAINFQPDSHCINQQLIVLRDGQLYVPTMQRAHLDDNIVKAMHALRLRRSLPSFFGWLGIARLSQHLSVVLLASDLVEKFLAAGCQRPPFRLALLFVLVCGAQTKVRMYMIDGCTMMKRKCINNITTQRSEALASYVSLAWWEYCLYRCCANFAFVTPDQSVVRILVTCTPKTFKMFQQNNVRQLMKFEA